jgi:hypothetical protein
MPSEKSGGIKQMYLRCWPFRWTFGFVESMHVTLPKKHGGIGHGIGGKHIPTKMAHLAKSQMLG